MPVVLPVYRRGTKEIPLINTRTSPAHLPRTFLHFSSSSHKPALAPRDLKTWGESRNKNKKLSHSFTQGRSAETIIPAVRGGGSGSVLSKASIPVASSMPSKLKSGKLARVCVDLLCEAIESVRGYEDGED